MGMMMSKREFYFSTTNKNGDTQRLVLVIDVEAIASRLAPKVRVSKRGKATAFHGAIVAQALSTNAA
jgi:hypothetical protein